MNSHVQQSPVLPLGDKDSVENSDRPSSLTPEQMEDIFWHISVAFDRGMTAMLDQQSKEADSFSHVNECLERLEQSIGGMERRVIELVSQPHTRFEKCHVQSSSKVGSGTMADQSAAWAGTDLDNDKIDLDTDSIQVGLRHVNQITRLPVADVGIGNIHVDVESEQKVQQKLDDQTALLQQILNTFTQTAPRVIDTPGHGHALSRNASWETANEVWRQDHSYVYDEDEEATEAHANDLKLKDKDDLGSVFMHDDDLERPLYFVDELYKKHGLCQAVARSRYFHWATTAVVVVNALYIGIEADWNSASNLYNADWPFQLFSQFFCVYFTLELLLRLVAFQRMSYCWRDGWFTFDLFLVTTMILDSWILMPILFVLSGSGGGSVRIPTQPLRMLRLFKLTRLAFLMRSFPELITMIKGLVRATRAISSSLVLLALLMYTWAIIMHMLLSNEDALNEELYKDYDIRFTSIGYCMWALFMNGIQMLDNTAPMLRTLIFSSQVNILLGGVALVIFNILSATLILQMLIGVLCDVVSQVSHEQRDAIAIGYVKQELLGELKRHDDGNGKITKEELMVVLRSRVSQAVFRKLNVNRLFLLELQDMLFPTPESEVSIKKILDLLVLCRGDNPATVQILSAGFLFLANAISGSSHKPTHHIHHSADSASVAAFRPHKREK